MVTAEEELRRSTVYIEESLHRALRIKSAETERTISALVNEAIRLSLAEDAEDLAAFEERKNEPDLAFEDVIRIVHVGKVAHRRDVYR